MKKLLNAAEDTTWKGRCQVSMKCKKGTVLVSESLEDVVRKHFSGLCWARNFPPPVFSVKFSIFGRPMASTMSKNG